MAEQCDYCGLPLAEPSARRTRGTVPDVTPTGDEGARIHRYCCYGCRFAATLQQQSDSVVGDSRELAGAMSGTLMTRLGLALFFTMNVMVFTLFLWSGDDELNGTAHEVVLFHEVARYVCLLFTAPVIVLLGVPLVEDAWEETRHGRPSTSGLLALGVLTAFIYSLISVIRGTGHVYFEVSCVVLVAVTLGRWLEATGKLRTTAALRGLQQLLPDEVCVIIDGEPLTIDRQLVVPGNLIRVLAGQRIPVDGLVTRQSATVDQQAVTGESEPVVKEIGDSVFSGTLNLDGDLWIEATTRADEGILPRMIAAVEKALAAPNRYQRLANRISEIFLPLVIAIALGTLAVHWHYTSLAAGLLAAMSVIVIACPCALGLATPLALWASVGQAARRQILLKDADSLIRLAAVRQFYFDKTGTLTTGDARLVDICVLHEFPEGRVLQIAALVARSSQHPLAQAIVRHVDQVDGPALAAEHSRESFAGRTGLAVESLPLLVSSRTIPGRGVSAELQLAGHSAPITVQLGSLRWMKEQSWWDDGAAFSGWSATVTAKPHTCLAIDGCVVALFGFEEQLRATALETLISLRRSGYEVRVLTGDSPDRAATLAAQLQVPVEAGLLPEEKLARVQPRGFPVDSPWEKTSPMSSKGAQGRGRATDLGVAMIGDGINDAPALAGADVSIALGCGTDISRFTAGICLLSNELGDLPWLIRLAQQTERTIRWNLLWAFAYNVAGISLAAAGLLHPIAAAIAMGLSGLLVVTNSLALGRWEMA